MHRAATPTSTMHPMSFSGARSSLLIVALPAIRARRRRNRPAPTLRCALEPVISNAGAPLATNAIAGNIWDNFSSASYKELPSVGAVTVYDPFTGEPRQYQMPA